MIKYMLNNIKGIIQYIKYNLDLYFRLIISMMILKIKKLKY